MSQKDTWQELDAEIFEAFAEAGMTYAATYTGPGEDDEPVPGLTVLLDRNVRVYGDMGEVVGKRVELHIQLRQLANPRPGGQVVIGADTWELADRVAGGEDESLSRWIVEAVA